VCYEANHITTIIPIAIGTVVLRPAQTDHSLVRLKFCWASNEHSI